MINSKKIYPPSIISVDMKVKGNLTSENEIHVDGSVEGDISCRHLHVGINGLIKGEINAEKVFINGTVNGTIYANLVSLGKTARILGDVYHDNLSIETGAFIEGLCHHKDKSKN